MRGVPVERATFLMKPPPVQMVERLEPWAGAAHFSEEMILEDEEHISPCGEPSGGIETEIWRSLG